MTTLYKSIVILLLVLLLVALGFVIFMWFFPITSEKKTGVVSKNIKNFKQKELDVLKNERELLRIKILSDMFSKFPPLMLTESRISKYQRYINRLDLKIKGVQATPETIHVMQSTITLIYCLFVVALSAIAKPIILAVFLSYFVYGAYERVLEGRIAKSNKMIELDFPEFYGMVYYQYKNINNTPPLEVVVKSYLPYAGSDIKYMLKRLLSNLDYGELKALAVVRSEFDIKNVIRFCNDMSTRVSGEDNTANLAIFKSEVDKEQWETMLKELTNFKRKMRVPVGIIFAIAIQYLIMYYWSVFESMGGLDKVLSAFGV